MAVISLHFLTGCSYYFKVETKTRVTAEDIRWADFDHKYMILHHGATALNLSKPEITDNMVSGNLSMLPNSRLQYKSTDPGRANRYKKVDIDLIMDQVHVYLQDSILSEIQNGDNIKFDVSAIGKMETYQKAKGRTTASWVIPAIGGTVLAAAGVVIIVALTKSSCPLVYIKQDSSFTFSGEIFGGAIYSSLERHDYLPLPGFEPTKNRYELKITNGLPEIQYINLAELWIVSHPQDVKVLPDRWGMVHTIRKPELPDEALSSAKSDILPRISMKDRTCFQFDEAPALTGDTSAFNTAVLTFTVPAGADTGKLVISAGNSMWGDYVFGELTKLFGNRYEEFIRWQGKRSPEKTLQWQKDQHYPLMVWLETGTGWKFVDYFDLIGPLGARDMVMPVGLSEALFTKTPDNGRSVRIKLESGFKFWDLDYAAMDFSGDTLITVDRVQPASAINETGQDVMQMLSKNDNRYYIQEKTGEEGLIIYKDSPEIPGMKKSLFLHTKGYYTHVRNYPNPPDKKQLQTMLVPGKFSRFSADKYAEFMEKKMVFVSDPRLP
jgi:hypothetical protein